MRVVYVCFSLGHYVYCVCAMCQELSVQFLMCISASLLSADLPTWKCPQETRWMLVAIPCGMTSGSILSKMSLSLTLTPGNHHGNKK